MKTLAPIRKAVLAAGFAAAAALGAAMLDGNITGAECVVSGGMGLLAGVATWRVPNKPVA